MPDGKVVYKYIGDTSDIDKYNKQAEQKVTSGAEKLKSALVPYALAIGTAFAAAGAASIKMGMDFETSMAGVSTLFGDTAVDTDGLNDKILTLSDNSGQLASTISDTLYDAISSGLPVTEDMSEAMGYLEKNTKLAEGGFTDVKTASSATLAVMNAYKLGVEDVDRIHKILMQTQNKGVVTVGQLGDYLAEVTPTAAAFGVSFEQVGAAISTMTLSGTKPAQAVTKLNQLLNELGKSGQVASKNLDLATKGTEYAGMSFQELTAKGLPLNDIINLMGDYAKKNGKNLNDMFGSVEASSAALQIAGENSAAYADSLKAMSTEEDVVAEAAKKIESTNAWKMQQVLTILKNVAIELYENGLKPLIAKLYDIGKWMTEHKAEADIIAIAIGIITTEILAYAIAQNSAAIAAGIATTATKAWTAAQWMLNIAMDANPIGLTIIAIGSLVAMVKSFTAAVNSEIETANKWADEEVAANKKVYDATVSRVQKSQTEEDKLYTDNSTRLQKEQSDKIAAEQKKTEAAIDAAEKRKSVLDDEHTAAIQAIQDEYGVFEQKEKSKTEVLQDTQKSYDESVSSMLASAKTAATSEGKAFSDAENQILQAARATHDAKIALYVDEYLASVGIINSQLSATVKGYQDQIDANNKATKDEEARTKRLSDAKRLADLSDAISNADTTAEKATAQQEYTDEVQRQSRERRQTDREEENALLSDKISSAQQAALDEKDALLKTLTDRITAEQQKVTDNTNFKIGKIQEERQAKEDAENAAYAATKKNLDNASKYLTDKLNNEIIPEINKAYTGPKGSITLEEQRHKTVVDDLNKELKQAADNQKYADSLAKIHAYQIKINTIEVTDGTSQWIKNIQTSFWQKKIDKEYASINKASETGGSPGINSWATGTDNFAGGLAHINEKGGEIVNLPSGTQIIPHDASVEALQNMLSNNSFGSLESMLSGQFAASSVLNPVNITLDPKSVIYLDGREITSSVNGHNFIQTAIDRRL